jgi:hypothetical protein
MTTAARDNGRPIIVTDEDLMAQLADMLEKLKMVEAKLMRLARQGPIPCVTGVDASSATSQPDRAQSTARVGIEGRHSSKRCGSILRAA